MASTKWKWSVLIACQIIVSAESSKPEFWKGTPLDTTVEKMRTSCAEDDAIACLQMRAFTFLDSLLKGEYFQQSDEVQMRRNNYQPSESSQRSQDQDLESATEEFLKSYDVEFKVPLVGSVTMDSRSLDESEVNLKFKFGTEARGKKSKLKRIFAPIIAFVLLKAITIVPLAIGILGIKAWNGLQLAFISFVISAGLAIFQFCQKLAEHNAHSHAHISAASPWDSPVHIAAARAAQGMAYSAYEA